VAAAKKATKKATKRRSAAKQSPRRSGQPKLLSGGNPQIPKGYGDAPVQAYIAAIPDWKRGVARQLDALITRAVPQVRKAVKWNSPLYGLDDKSWFASFHCFDRYVKVAFFRGKALKPMPPVASKTPSARYLHVHQDEPLDAAQFTDWVKQASRLPGERM
jgi:hypothetical protein